MQPGTEKQAGRGSDETGLNGEVRHGRARQAGRGTELRQWLGLTGTERAGRLGKLRSDRQRILWVRRRLVRKGRLGLAWKERSGKAST